MKNSKITCHVCTFKMESEDVVGKCQRCGADFQNPEKEQLKKNDVGDYVRKGSKSQCLSALFLTNKRLFLVVARKGILGFGADAGASGAIALKLGGGSKDLEFSIPLENIETVSEKKAKLSKFLFIKTKGNEEYNLNMQNIINKKAQEEWVEVIAKEAGIQ